MDSHHARLVISTNPEGVVRDYRLHATDADIVPFVEDTLSIGTVRTIIEAAYQTPGQFEYRLITMCARSIAVEAQQALLKILEEPPLSTRFLIVLPGTASLLPTVLSRLVVTYDEGVVATDDFDALLNASYKDRMELIAEAAKQKDGAQFESWYNGLTQYMLKHETIDHESMKVVLLVLSYARARGASKKMLWEEIALSLPIKTK